MKTYGITNKEKALPAGRQGIRIILRSLTLIPLSLLLLASCQKIEYTVMEGPAYLRVFNSLNYLQIMENKGDTIPYLCMLINPELDATGLPIGAEIVGDHLDVRNSYAPPYPVHIGVSTTANNPEYPGKESVLAGPILNGYDLSSWAQVPSGDQRIVFFYRPKNEVPFFDLPEREKRGKLIDTVVRLDEGEIYTMNVLMRDFATKSKGLMVRQENFHKQPLSDSLVYLNFYNYSAVGYWQAALDEKLPTGSQGRHLFAQGIRDTMNLFLTLMENQEVIRTNLAQSEVYVSDAPASLDYEERYLTTLYRDLRSGQAKPYVNFPLWLRGNGPATDVWQRIHFYSPGQQPGQSTSYVVASPLTSFAVDINTYVATYNGSHYAVLNCLLNGPLVWGTLTSSQIYHLGASFPNLVVSTHSGTDNPRSFGTVNTIEVINGEAYLMTIQRRYAPPIY